MMKMIALIKRKAGLSSEQFREHYETSHAPLITELLPFFTDYRRNYQDPSLQFHPDHVEAVYQGPDFDVMTEISFASKADYEKMVTALEDPQIAERIRADEEQFIDRASIALYMTEEVVNPQR